MVTRGTAIVRFNEELNDFLPTALRKRDIDVEMAIGTRMRSFSRDAAGATPSGG